MHIKFIFLTVAFLFILGTKCTSIDLQQEHASNSNQVGWKKLDFYEYRHTVADGVQKALDECRQLFKWDRWNCPRKAFLDILDRTALPSNKELSLTRALIASGIVLTLTRSCGINTNNICGCSQATNIEPMQFGAGVSADPTSALKFNWRGCDESIKFGFKVSKMYLENQDKQHDETSRRINAHNYEVGRLAVKKNMKKVCKCHGPSATCQYKTCWIKVPDLAKVGRFIKNQYHSAAKVGAISSQETNVMNLNEELANISQEKLVFVDPSPDYCYENHSLGLNGTLGRYCSRATGTEVSKVERESCNRLCTKCGYKIKKEVLNVGRQCDCRFVYCCSVECKRCPHVQDTYRCARHII